MKKQILLPILTIALCAALLLACSFGLAPTGAGNARKAHEQLMKTLLPGSENFVVEPYAGEDANIRSVHRGENGYVIETSTYGYADNITMFVGVSLEGKVQGLVVAEAHETFGLGNEALTDHVFLSQFLNKGGSFAVAAAGADVTTEATPESAPAAEGEAHNVDAITGATVTTKAIVRCVNSAVAYVSGADVVSEATVWEG